jgi:hypothetical protein
MRRILEQIDEMGISVAISADDQALVRSGFELVDGALLLTDCLNRMSTAPARYDRWDKEWWVNKVLLASERDAGDPLWRPELAAYGLVLAEAMLDAADGVAELPVQVLVNLQSADGEADPDIDFTVGAVHVFQVAPPKAGSPREDMSYLGDSQPAFTLTRPPH